MNTVEKAFEYESKEIAHLIYNGLIGGSILYLFAEILGRIGLERFIPYSLETNVILYLSSFTILYALFISVQKGTARYLGLEAMYDSWIYGPLIGFGISILTYGIFPLLYLGTVKAEPREDLRLGRINQSINASDLFTIGASGIVFLFLLITIILEPLFVVTNSPFFRILTITAAATMFYSTIPLPQTNGANLILKSRYGWLFMFAFSLFVFLFASFINAYLYLVILFLTFLIMYAVNKKFTNLI